MSRLHEVVGHQEARRALAGARRANSLPSTILLHGPEGVGKQRMGLWLGQLLLCEAPTETGPCEECRHCRLARRIEHPDLHWYFPLPRPKGSHSPERLADAIEEARGEELDVRRAEPIRATVRGDQPTGLYLAGILALRRRAQKAPSDAPRQIFLIGNAEELIPQESSPEAANALLKLLEEPPESTYFILTSSEPGRLLATIRSRAQSFFLAPLPLAEVRDFLTDATGAGEEDADRAARLGLGSIGRALGYLPEESGENGPLEQVRQDAFHLLRGALQGGRGHAFPAALDYPVAGARNLGELFDHLALWIRDLGAAAAGRADAVLNPGAGDHLRQMAEHHGLHPSGAAAALEAVEEARVLASGNVNPQLLVFGLLRDLGRGLLAGAAGGTDPSTPARRG